MDTPVAVAQIADASQGANDTLIARACADGTDDWRHTLRQAIRSLDKLLAALGLSAAEVGVSPAGARQFPVLVPPELLAAMEPGNPRDPLLLQVLPGAPESLPQPAHFSTDPLQETAQPGTPGVIRKYRGRALLIMTGACAVHCRYCFRRHFPYAEASVTPARWQAMRQALAADPGLREVILSGGDPLLVGDESLDGILADLEAIPQLRYLRIHTRIPLVLPERISPWLATRIAASGRPMTVVIHCNHRHELTPAACAALGRLREQGVTLLNQSVLLKDINDNCNTLAELSEALFQAGVLPYYLHQLDTVAGAAHFHVSEAEARRLHADLKACLPGYLVPRLVREVPGDTSKRWIG